MNQLHPAAGLVQQRRRLYSALAAPDHRHTGAAGPAEIAMGPAVRGNRFGKRFRKVRDVGEAVDPGRHHDPPRLHGPAIGQVEAEAAIWLTQRFHVGSVDVGDGMPLEPEAVVDEVRQRNRQRRRRADCVRKAVQAVGAFWIRQARGAPGRSEVHAPRKALPEFHRLPEDEGRNPRPIEMCGD